MTAPPKLDPLDPLDTHLIDLRASAEAFLRTLTAAQACLDHHRHNGNGNALRDCAKHVEELKALHVGIAATMIDTAASLTMVTSSGASSSGA